LQDWIPVTGSVVLSAGAASLFGPSPDGVTMAFSRWRRPTRPTPRSGSRTHGRTYPGFHAADAEFAGLAAQRYAGKVSAWAVWNEPNTVLFWAPAPDPVPYTNILKAAYPAIKAADPNATVVGGVLTWVTDYRNLTINPDSYLQQMDAAAGARGNFDALSYHPYQYDITLSQGLPYGDITPVNQLQLRTRR